MSSQLYWERRKAQRMFEYMQSAEDTADEIAQLYYKASGYLTHQSNQIFEKFLTKHGLSVADAYRLLNTLQDRGSLDELKMVLAVTKDRQAHADLLAELRAVKDPEELEIMIAAQRIAEKALTDILNEIRPGVAEKEIAARLQYLMLHYGAEDKSFDPIVVSGPNGSLPHGVPSEKVIQAGEFVTMDFGCIYHGYCSDMTRTVAVGSVTDEMRQVYDTVLQAQLAGIAAARAGATGKAVDGAARDIIRQAGYGPCFGHSFGHGVGVEIHEGPNATPSNDKPLPAGAVISAEPGIYLPGKLGVRIEDVLYLTPEGCQNLTLAPKELVIL